MRVLSLAILVCIVSLSLGSNAPNVTTAIGKIRGRYSVSHHGQQYEVYEGIPYAIPPVGTRRFQPPEPINFWPGELLANKTGNSCLQHLRSPNERSQIVIGNEDCLYLNVYAPSRKNNQSLPVIFWIHDGAFRGGSGSGYEAKYLVDYQIILVTINYRLGVLGFLSTEDAIVTEDVPGNMGLKDQSLALRWVHENIKHFGGDSKRITLAGAGAGGASVHYHYLSPMSADLFHSGISFGGTAFNSWAQAENLREKSHKLAELVGCPTNDIPNMIRCLKSRPAEALVDAELYFMPWQLNPLTPFGPVVERRAEKPFINRPPIDIIKSGHAQDLPWITSVVREDGLFPVAEFALKSNVLKELNETWEFIAPHLLDYYYTIPKDYHADVARAIRNHYFSDKPINKENILTLTHLVGDRLYVADAAKAAKYQAKYNKNPVWFYQYTYRALQTNNATLVNSTKNLGVYHSDDADMVLENRRIVPTLTRSDFAMHKDLLKLWTVVARTGKPEFGPKWPKVDKSNDKLDYLEIAGPGKFKVKSDKNLGQKLFWQSIDFNENREIIKSYAISTANFYSPNCVQVFISFILTYLLTQCLNIQYIDN